MAEEEISKIVDENNDLLDDRIVKPNESKNADASDIAYRIANLRLTELPEDLLRSMLNDIDIEQDSLTEKAATLERSLHNDLLQGHGSVIDGRKKEARMIEREFEALTDDRVNVYNALQNRILTNRMQKTLGGKMQLYLSEALIFSLIVLVLGILTYEYLYLDQVLDKDTIMNIFYLDTICCLIFLTEFTLRYQRADDKRWFWRNHWVDFVTSIPLPPASLFGNTNFVRFGRTFRLVRIIRVLRMGRAFRIIFFFWRGLDKISDVMDIKLMKKSFKILIISIIFGGVMIRYIEGGSTNVSEFTQSIWWSFTTVVTSGFGDMYNPQSTAGRVLTIFLVIIGMVVVGIFTATLTSLYVEEGTEELQLMQQTLDDRFLALAASHEQGSKERQQGVQERKALDKHLREGLDEMSANFKVLSDSHDQGSKERQQGVKERKILDDHLREGLDEIFSNQKAINDRLDNLEKKLNNK